MVNISEFVALTSERSYPTVLLPHFTSDRLKTAPVHQMDDSYAYMGKTFLGKVRRR